MEHFFNIIAPPLGGQYRSRRDRPAIRFRYAHFTFNPHALPFHPSDLMLFIKFLRTSLLISFYHYLGAANAAPANGYNFG
jgi:hypothetical protein